jgi:hypothetical protein
LLLLANGKEPEALVGVARRPTFIYFDYFDEIKFVANAPSPECRTAPILPGARNSCNFSAG